MGMHTTKVAVGEGKFALEEALEAPPLHSRCPRDVTKGQSVCHIPFLRNLQILQVSKVTSYKLAKNASL